VDVVWTKFASVGITQGVFVGVLPANLKVKDELGELWRRNRERGRLRRVRVRNEQALNDHSKTK